MQGTFEYLNGCPIWLQPDDVLLRTLSCENGCVSINANFPPFIFVDDDSSMRHRWKALSAVAKVDYSKQDEYAESCGCIPPYIISLLWNDLEGLQWLGRQIKISSLQTNRHFTAITVMDTMRRKFGVDFILF